MKQSLLLLLLFPFAGWAVPPEKILPKTLELRPLVWYRQQAKAWSEETSRDGQNPNTWLNYYAASCYSQDQGAHLDEIVASMEKAVPNSYELLLVKGWSKGYHLEAIPWVRKAYEMCPEKNETYGLLQVLSELDLDLDARAIFSKKVLASSQLSPSLLSYSYNVLMSVDPSAILITEGESTTSPLFVLQDVLKIRTDVSILNLDLLTDGDYLEKKFKTLGLSINEPVRAPNLRNTLCSLLPLANRGRKFYYALTVSKDNLSSMKENLYVVGLASVHSLTSFDNVAQIRRNLEQQFLLDYLKVDFNGETGFATGRVLSSNYLVPMLLLYDSYVKENKIEQAEELKQRMKKIAHDSGKESLILDFLDREGKDSEIPYFPFSMDIKALDDEFHMISDNLYAQESEVTNQQYNRFLNYLSSNSLQALHEKFDFDFSDYTEPALTLMKNYSADRSINKKQKYFTQYPAVDISYDAAKAYCDWLTQQYNHSKEHRFKKVKFRLPSIEEYQIAAAGIKNPTSWKLDEQKTEVKITPEGQPYGRNFEKKIVSLGDPEILYPWFRYFKFRNSPVNNYGCYLGNFKVPDQGTCPGVNKFKGIAADGWSMTAPVGTYFPNELGLSDMVGNVAEMTLEKGKACGGSWNHSPEESTMRSVNTYSKPDAAIGFRVYMEILEK